KQIFIDVKAGMHNHYTTFSPDGRWVYFVRGKMRPADLDIWRIPVEGGTPERMTAFHARVAYPSFLDKRTLIFTATRQDGSGSGLYAMDVDRRISHPVSFGLEDYVSIAAS